MERAKNNLLKNEFFVIGVFSLILLMMCSEVILADPTNPSSVTYLSNVTSNPSSQVFFNISGGRIGTFNLTAIYQNPRWKGFVGNASGSFTLSDASGSNLYNWNIASITGKIYATRNSSSINWGLINCSSLLNLTNEDFALDLTNATAPSDNLTQTFNCTSAGCAGSNVGFYVGAVPIPQNTCPTINTYINSQNQTLGSPTFQETALYTPQGGMVYEAPIEPPGTVGYNGQQYNFQMIVPENATPGFNSSTAYYVYVELGV